MARQSWELKRLWLPTNVVWHPSAKDKQSGSFLPEWDEHTRKVWAEAEALSANGWELVGMTPETGGHESWWDVINRAFGVGSSFTVGYYLIFKRPKL